jgi:N-acetylneuraminic acid mutarotase
MSSTEETLVAMRREMRPLLEMVMEGMLTKARGVLEDADQQRIKDLAEVAEERARGLAEVAEQHAKGLALVEARRAELTREVATMHKHMEAQEGRVELNIGGYHFHTSVQALRRVPHTFFDAYFSGRYAQDVCVDGSIFVDRDGEHFGHVLEYMRDGVVSVAEPGVCPSVSLLRALKREFGFYCIELYAAPAPMQPEVAYVMGGYNDGGVDEFGYLYVTMAYMDKYNASTGQWSAAASMQYARQVFGACIVAGELYVSGGHDINDNPMSSVEKYSPLSDTWSAGTPLPVARSDHAAVAVGPNMYVLGGLVDDEWTTASVLKFDSVQGTYLEVAPMPEARRNLAACAIGSDIFVFGGGNGANVSSVLKLDTLANEWSILGPMPTTCRYHSVSVLNDLVYIVGASWGYNMLRFDHATEVWSELARTSINRREGSSFVLDDCLYAAGGEGDSGAGTASAERYDVATDTWILVADMLEARQCSSAITIGSAGPAEEQDLFDTLIAKASRDQPDNI